VLAHLQRDAADLDSLIVVADGGSTDGTPDIVRRIAALDPRVKLLPNPKKFQACGVNHAVATYGDGCGWLVRIDAHAGYPQGYVPDLLAEARRTQATAVVVSLDAQGEGLFQRVTAATQNSSLGAGGSPHRRQGVQGWVDHGHHALVRMDAFRAIGGYDERFTHNEDAEFDRLLADYGGRIWLTDQVGVVYHPRNTAKALWRQYVNYGRGRARTIRKHRMRPKLRQMLPAAVAPAVLVTPLSLVFWPAAIPAALWTAAALGYGALLALKARDPALVLSGPVAMEMHLAWSIGFWREVAFGPRFTS
jgi:succinoglycan biosynthesis protein ExoA